jgi:4-amino-4-deoxy-L-arabinose transferase-like glycosyltransferase
MLRARALARLWFYPSTALLAAAALATAELFGRLGRAGVLDVPLTSFTLLAIYGWARHRRRGGASIALFYAGIGLAVLVKGPVGVLFPVLAAAALRAAAPEPAAGGRAHFLWGPPFALAVIAAWLVPACVRGGESYANAILLKQNVGRAVDSFSHRRPVWYYVPYLLAGFFPWSLLLPGALVQAWRARREQRSAYALLLFFAAAFVIFSLISGKRGRYLLPLYPALAILVAHYAVALSTGPLPRRSLARQGAAIAAVVLSGAGVGLALFSIFGRRLVARFAADSPDVVDAFADIGRGSAPWFLVAGGLGMALLGRLARRAAAADTARAALLLAGQAMVLLFLYDVVLTPRIDRFKSPREIAETIARIVPPGGAAATYPTNFAGAYNLYSGRLRIETLEEPEQVEAFLASPAPNAVLTSEEHLAPFADSPRIRVIEAGRVGHRRMVFLTAAADAGAGGG